MTEEVYFSQTSIILFTWDLAEHYKLSGLYCYSGESARQELTAHCRMSQKILYTLVTDATQLSV